MSRKAFPYKEWGGVNPPLAPLHFLITWGGNYVR